jgi:hypothetical protein
MAKEQRSPEWLVAWDAVDEIERLASQVEEVNARAAADIVTVALRVRRHLMGDLE